MFVEQQRDAIAYWEHVIQYMHRVSSPQHSTVIQKHVIRHPERVTF
jgi:hypothetical protein